MRALADHSTTEHTGCRSGYVATGSACVAPTSASSTTRASSSASSTVKPTTTTRASTSATTSRVSTSTSAAPAASSTGWPTSGGLIAGGYYPDWVEDVMPPEALNYKMFDLINYAFALPTSDYVVSLPDYSGSILKRVVKLAHGNNTKVNLAVGGWTDSVYFSGAVSTASRRTKFVKSIVDLVNQYNLDGVDIDWCYPGTNGNPGNQISSSDTANLLKMLTELRTALPKKLLSTCTTQSAYIGADGSPLTDVKAFANVLDHILVMNYDVWGASSTPGPNAPLRDDCSGSLQPNANMQSAIDTWTDAGMPASKILMGIPAYGYVSSSSATSLIHKRDEAASDILAKRDVIVCPNDHSGKPCAGVTGQNISEIDWNPLSGGNSTGGGSTGGGDGVFQPGHGPGKVGTGNLSGLEGNQIQFVDLINYGVIVEDTSTTKVDYIGTNGYTRKWDTCSSTPFLYNKSRKVVITYDDPESLAAKGKLAVDNKIGGMLMWDLSGDTLDFQLTKAYRSAMGV
ncbi:glycoside hydrolase [Rhodotorula diobovata]|uniref:Glycoside hydrolase n=1 Tax=Rhodotorula diobovata TaxID=5288 RepID=A0A5C5FS58_9BASI|nr:glycoside hydrolase [Rhodotorula diobovata]